MFGWELDMLEGRLHTLDPYVDRFVITESDHHFQNQPKGYVLEQNWDRFVRFHDKITYVQVKSELYEDPWDNEIQQRRAAEPVLESMGLQDSDVITVCDVDEWWDPASFPCDFDVVAFNMAKYNMSLHWYHKHELTGVGGKWWYFKDRNLDHERRKRRHKLPCVTGGVHLTTMGDVGNAIRKMSGYAHSEYNDGTLEEATVDCWENAHFYGEQFTETEFDEFTPAWIREYRFPADWYRRKQ
jgi:beta-1,4-mannosyl-glycoprotein beta-1,4-N-acetylglucosaminyltransferase